jgi:hypothetical protein
MPTWMIEELERRRQEREEQARPQLWIEIPAAPAPVAPERSEQDRPREPIVIELW